MANYEKEKLKSHLSKANLPSAVYDTNQIGNHKKFISRVTVKTIDYTGIGSSSNKEHAESLAARDFVAHLQYQGLINQSTLPSDLPNIQHDPMPPVSTHNTSMPTVSTQNTSMPIVSTHDTSMPPDFSTLGDPTLVCTESDPFLVDNIPDESNLAEKRIKKIELNGHLSVFESWTLENCKYDLHNFAISNGITLNYNYRKIAPKTEWFCNLSIFVNRLGHELKASVFAQSKKLASKACALEMIRKLHSHGLIKPSSYTIREARRKDNKAKNLSKPGTSYSILLTPKRKVMQSISFDKEKIESKKRIGWCPPTPIWDAWLGRETNGLLCKMSLQQISIGLKICSSVLASPMKLGINYEQSILPVWKHREEILCIISNNPVVFICGSIACGKTTQVPQFILDDFIEQGNGALCNIIMTQHRHTSAITIAERILYERCEHFKENSSVGYDIGHRSMIPRPFGAILFCTIDLLLKKMEDGLRGISHIIIDECHEPNSNKEFLMTVLHGMIQIHPKLRVIFMGTSFGITALKHFPNSPVINITH